VPVWIPGVRIPTIPGLTCSAMPFRDRVEPPERCSSVGTAPRSGRARRRSAAIDASEATRAAVVRRVPLACAPSSGGIVNRSSIAPPARPVGRSPINATATLLRPPPEWRRCDELRAAGQDIRDAPERRHPRRYRRVDARDLRPPRPTPPTGSCDREPSHGRPIRSCSAF
jgi:hypothetical protein